MIKILIIIIALTIAPRAIAGESKSNDSDLGDLLVIQTEKQPDFSARTDSSWYPLDLESTVLHIANRVVGL